MLLELLARNVIASWDSGDLARAVREMGEYLEEMDAVRKRHGFTIAAARGDYEDPSDSTIEIDDDPLLSVGEDGVWVSAWVYIPNDTDLPKPPPGYSAEELDRDNPYNQWMHE